MEAKKYLLEVEASPITKNNERIQYLCSIMEAFLYKVSIKYNNVALLKTSYQKIINNGQIQHSKQQAVLYYFDSSKDSNDFFYLDPRVW